MIRARSITLTRAEGPAAECDRPQTVSSWSDANLVLWHWSETAPSDCQTYDKCDFIITYEDGETYEGRYDLKHHICGYPDLGKHVRDFVTFHAGRHKPAWMSEEQYREFLETPYFKKMKSEFEHFLESYEIGVGND